MGNEAPVKKTARVVKVYEKITDGHAFERVGYFVCELSNMIVISNKRVVENGQPYYGDLLDISKDKIEHYKVIFEEDYDRLGAGITKELHERKAESEQK
jgi:hypothetical protein